MELLVALPVVGVEPVGWIEDGFDHAGVLGFDAVVFGQLDLCEERLVDLALLRVVGDLVDAVAVRSQGEVRLDAETGVGASGLVGVKAVVDFGELVGNFLLFFLQGGHGDRVVVEQLDELGFGVLQPGLLRLQGAAFDGGIVATPTAIHVGS